MSARDIEPALVLCRGAGWNQLREDWLRLISYEPNGCFIATCQGQLAGTVSTTRYGSDLGWIGMMLVDPECRRRGIATALIQHSVDYLRSHGVRCISLDATPVGLLVYQNTGFEVDWSFHRWRRNGSADGTPSRALSTSTRLNDQMLKLDRAAFGADRSVFLKLLSHESFSHVVSDGYGMLRSGFLASYLGPICAETAAVAETIAAELCARADGTIFWDIPAPNTDAAEIARSLGFTPVRDLTRMSLGAERLQPNLRLQYALADPAVG